MNVRDFPNVFIMGPAQAGFTANYPHLLLEQAVHISYVIDEARKRQARIVQPTEEAESGWVQTIIDNAALRRKFLEECTPGYYNNEGKPADRSEQNASYGAGSVKYFEILEDWRKAGKLDGLEIA
jgi:cyclohexanone monooxygenase